MWVSVQVLAMHVQLPRRPEEDIQSVSTGVDGGYELPDMSARKLLWVLRKGSKPS